MTRTLTCVSESVLGSLRKDVRRNLDRYRGGGFSDLAGERGWSIEVDPAIDLSPLAGLDGIRGGAAGDLANTRLINTALHALSPSLANEERIWVRLSHVEGFAYSRDRWLKEDLGEEGLVSTILTHFFAPTQTQIRDDHAISRLWWNAWIAGHCYPENPALGLELMLSRADVRSNLVERVWLTGRHRLARGLFRAMDQDPLVLASERSFREFMKSLNILGAGVVFEAMNEGEIDEFMIRCREHATAAIGGGNEE